MKKSHRTLIHSACSFCWFHEWLPSSWVIGLRKFSDTIVFSSFNRWFAELFIISTDRSEVYFPRGSAVHRLVWGVAPPHALDQPRSRGDLPIEMLLTLLLLDLQCESRSKNTLKYDVGYIQVKPVLLLIQQARQRMRWRTQRSRMQRFSPSRSLAPCHRTCSYFVSNTSNTS